MASLKDLLSRSSKFPAGVVGTAVQSALEKRRAQQEERAAEAVSNVVEQAATNLENMRIEFKDLKKRKDEAARNLKKLERTFAFFMETGNPLPMYGEGEEAEDFCQAVGVDVPNSGDSAWSVPNDWVPMQPTEPVSTTDLEQ